MIIVIIFSIFSYNFDSVDCYVQNEQPESLLIKAILFIDLVQLIGFSFLLSLCLKTMNDDRNLLFVEKKYGANQIAEQTLSSINCCVQKFSILECS